MTEIREWLEELGLGRYADAFEAEEITSADVPNLSDAMLKDLGLPMGPRSRVLTAAKQRGGSAPSRRPAAKDKSASAAQELADPQREAERRQLTVMFCDMVGSTALSERLDPEDLREVMRAFQDACAGAVARLDGYIAQTLGDGMMVYFGFPRAHEDDAHRAIRAGLDIIESVKVLSERLSDENSVSLSVRLGVHTGMVVAGEVGGADTRADMAIVGETPNIAARLQSLAQSDTLLIGSSTYALVRDQFEFQDLGSQELKGVSQSLRVYKVIDEHVAETRFEAGHGARLAPLVSRDAEMELLRHRWEQAKGGQGQVVLLSGEAGIGKSRIVQALRDTIANEPHNRMRYQCSPYHTNSAFYPIIEQLKWAARIGANDLPDTKLEKLGDVLRQSSKAISEDLPLFADLMSIPTGDRFPTINLNAQRKKEKTIKAMVDNLFALSDQQPLLYIVEDAHWIDPSTLEVLELVADRAPSWRILILITYRPEFVPPWSNEPHVTVHPLSRLSPQTCAIVMDSVTGGKALPDEVVEQIVAKTDGVPLFVEELTKTVIESGLLEDRGDRYEISGPLQKLAIPTTLHDSLMARLDRLASVKEVAQIGACIGREFSYELLSAVSPLGDNELRDALQVLVNNELVFRRGNPPNATVTFKHALIEDAAYQSLLKSKRHQFHQQIAEALKSRFPDTVETKPESLAHHYTEAGLDELAITYWLKAGRLASARSENIEAIAHLGKGIELVRRQPDSAKRDRIELDLQVAIGTPLIAVKSWTARETRDAYSRARDLCQVLGNPPELFPVLYGLWAHRWTRADLDGARDLAEEFLREAERQEARAPRMVANRALGTTLFGYGEFNLALQRLQRTVDLYDQSTDAEIAHIYGMDPNMGAADYIAWARWLLGFPDEALQKSEEALVAVRQISHFYSSAFALAWHALILLLRGDYDGAREQAELCLPMSLEQRFPFLSSCSRIFRGWALASRGEIPEGVTDIESGLAEYRAIGGEVFKPTWICVMADISGRLGRPDEGLNALDKAFALVGETKERWWEAELHRSRGQLMLMAKDAKIAEAEQSFRKAIEVAQSQRAKSLELRAATSLARMWQKQGKKKKAHDLLAPVYDWFTEGFDTADLKDAKALLGELN